MTSLKKPFYEIEEILERWQMTRQDMLSFVLSDQLTVSITAAGLPIIYGRYEEIDENLFDKIPAGCKWVIGTIDLNPVDAWQTLRYGKTSVTSFKSPKGDFQEIDEGRALEGHAIATHDLVITRNEVERFEREQLMFSQPIIERRRGAQQRYDWESFYIEAAGYVYDEGVPATQAEFVNRMSGWFTSKGFSCPDDSTIKKKLKPLWQRLKQEDLSNQQAPVSASSPATLAVSSPRR